MDSPFFMFEYSQTQRAALGVPDGLFTINTGLIEQGSCPR